MLIVPLESAAHWIVGRMECDIPSSSMVSNTQSLSIYPALERGHRAWLGCCWWEAGGTSLVWVPWGPGWGSQPCSQAPSCDSLTLSAPNWVELLSFWSKEKAVTTPPSHCSLGLTSLKSVFNCDTSVNTWCYHARCPPEECLPSISFFFRGGIQSRPPDHLCLQESEVSGFFFALQYRG